MEFGVFDHLDRDDQALGDYYRSRLQIIEAYDRLGFYAYHVAEHHATPLGMAPSPSVFLAAVAQRTRRLRFGPLVYALPLYHPLRMIEEICMLDQMSGGRLEIGFGRGSSPSELIYYGQDPDKSQKIYAEALELVIAGLTQRSLTFHGEFFHFDDVPMELEPLQKPHPPIWYGVHAPDSAARAARKGLQVVSLDPPGETCIAFDSFRAAWREARGAAPLPLMGLGRFIVVARDRRRGARRSRGAPIRAGTRASPICAASITGSMRIRGRPPSMSSPRSAKASRARPTRSPPLLRQADRGRPAAIIWSASSCSAICRSTRRRARSSCSRLASCRDWRAVEALAACGR